MPTLAAGQTFTAFVGDSGYVSVATNGGFATVTATPVAGTQTIEPIGPQPYRRNFGPFAEGATVTISSTSAEVNYDVSPSVSSLFVSVTAASVSSASFNTAAINAALANGGLVQIPGNLGDVYINGTLTIRSDTEFVVGAGTRIRLIAASGGANMLRNLNWNATMKAVTSVTSADGKTVTVQFPSAHGFAVGSYFFLIGCNPDTYNGVWPVKSVTTTSVANDTLTFTLSSHLGTETPLITSPATVNTAYTSAYGGTTTILASAADANITIRGGSWYYDVVANTNLVDYRSFGFYPRRIANLTIRDQFWESCRNPIVPANIYGGYYDNINCRNIGSLIQHSGSCRGIKIGTLRGDAWDDFATFLIGDYPGYADVTNGVYYGDMDEIDVGTLLGENAYRFMKFVGQSNFKYGTITVGKCHGRSPLGAAAGFSIQDDTGCTTMAGVTGAAGTYIESFSIDEIATRDAVGTHGMDVLNATVNTLNIGRLSMPMAPLAGAVAFAVANSATVNTLNITSFTVTASAYNGNPYGILQDATIGVVNIGMLLAKNIGYAYIQGTNATNNTEINIDKFVTLNCAQGVLIRKNGTLLNINYAERNGYQSSPWMQLDGNTEFNVSAGRGLYATDAFGGSAASKTPRNFIGIGVDVGGTGVIRQAGSMGMYVSGTARGTLVSNNVVVCDATGTTNSWKQVSNTTLTF